MGECHPLFGSISRRPICTYNQISERVVALCVKTRHSHQSCYTIIEYTNQHRISKLYKNRNQFERTTKKSLQSSEHHPAVFPSLFHTGLWREWHIHTGWKEGVACAIGGSVKLNWIKRFNLPFSRSHWHRMGAGRPQFYHGDNGDPRFMPI